MIAADMGAEGTVFGRPAALTRSAVRWRHSVVVLDAVCCLVMAPFRRLARYMDFCERPHVASRALFLT